MSNEDSDATDPRLDGGNLTGAAGALAGERGGADRAGPWPGSACCRRLRVPLSFTVPSDVRRREAGCPSGQRERSVKPSAKPTLVRTQHLPPPAKTAHDQRRRGQKLVLPGALMCGWGRAYAGGCAQYVPKIAAGSVIEVTPGPLVALLSSGLVASRMRRLALSCCRRCTWRRPVAARPRCGLPIRRPGSFISGRVCLRLPVYRLKLRGQMFRRGHETRRVDPRPYGGELAVVVTASSKLRHGWPVSSPGWPGRARRMLR